MATATKLKQANALLVRLNEAGLAKSFAQVKLEQAGRVLNVLREKRLNRFDIFRQAGFYADENRLSDALAVLFDPRGGHQLDLVPLSTLLETIAGKAPVSDAGKINAVLEQNWSYIRVYRERPEDTTRPDITITARDFIIFIENKVRGGTETFRSDKHQTVRQWEVLVSRYRQRGILVLGIFLSPEGTEATENNFVPLSVEELASSLRLALASVQPNPYRRSIEAFLDFYALE